jgi:hypothetical protein
MRTISALARPSVSRIRKRPHSKSANPLKNKSAKPPNNPPTAAKFCCAVAVQRRRLVRLPEDGLGDLRRGDGRRRRHPQRADVRAREKQIGGSEGSLEPSGPLLTHLHTVYKAYSECLPTRLDPLAERTCFSQVRALQHRDDAGLAEPGEVRSDGRGRHPTVHTQHGPGPPGRG